MFIGKLFLGMIGYFFAGLPGLLVGLFLGHLFDSGAQKAVNQATSEKGNLGSVFFEATFLCMGRMAKADGRVSPEEIRTAEEVIRRMGLNEQGREEAIGIFRHGKDAESAFEDSIDRLRASFASKPEALGLFLEIQINMAIADGHLDIAEVQLLRTIGARLGLPSGILESLLQRMQAEFEFTRDSDSGQEAGAPPSAHRLHAAYATLGVSEEDNDADIKKAYRRLMNQHHPDKLMAQGVPEDMLKAATDRARGIQEAWELVRRERGIR